MNYFISDMKCLRKKTDQKFCILLFGLLRTLFGRAMTEMTTKNMKNKKHETIEENFRRVLWRTQVQFVVSANVLRAVLHLHLQSVDANDRLLLHPPGQMAKTTSDYKRQPRNGQLHSRHYESQFEMNESQETDRSRV
jgi:hypothetical protein